MDKTKLLDHFSPEDRILLAKVLDRAAQSRQRGVPACTDFLSPQQQAQAAELLYQAGFGETDYVRLGGYQGAERQLILFLPDWMPPEDAESYSPIRCIRAVYRAEDKLDHRDLLGSLMGLGIVREKLGDLLVGEESCDVLVLESISDYLLANWETAGRAHLKRSSVELDAIHIPQQRCQEIRDTVSSLRLDAVAAVGFKLARGKAAALVESGKVQVNWTLCQKADKLLEEGDVVSARGYGKFELSQVGGFTRKGRTSILVKRYQ